MNYIKTFETFKLDEPETMSDLLEKLSVDQQDILDSIGAELININSFLNNSYLNMNIEELYNNIDFSNLLKIKGLKKSNIELTSDYETFLLNPFKFILLRKIDKTELHNPDFIIIQTYNDSKKGWNSLKIYKINGDFKNFYDKLSDRSIEINYNNKKFIYHTSNGKNEWELSNTDETDLFPKFIRKNDLLNLIKKTK